MPSHLFLFHFLFFHPLLLKRHGLTSYSHICLHLSTRKSYCYRYGFFICLVFFQYGWMLYFLSMASGFVFMYRMSLAFLHYAAISVELGLVSHSVIVLTNCMIEGFFGFVLLVTT